MKYADTTDGLDCCRGIACGMGIMFALYMTLVIACWWHPWSN